jgi:hypothetical protein
MHIFDQIAALEILHVDLGFSRYRLRVVEQLPDDEWAHTDTDTHEIALRCDLEDGPAREFLMHELTHCVLEVVGYTSEDVGKIHGDTNEDMTTKLSRGFLLLCRLNPELMSALCDDESTLDS